MSIDPTPAPATAPAAATGGAALLPCPFCGGGGTYGVGTRGVARGGHYIECARCEATTSLVFSAKEDAIPLLRERWNERVAGPPRDPNTKRLRDALATLVNAVEGGRSEKIRAAAQKAEDLLCKLEGVADD